ncbi:RUS1 family protein C16orf58 homolog isoform X2 [Cephus cinctus]|uniref:RUS1 family protein C16orf58 homolog isoform X2 n=1 Tax=Cephus cinctus TaxID=211228 RepID=A0AAJ7FQH2_CEPCN|nr:RUS1 family protein C16orf58 homolog isoform X2 [Cephus cinctus]
MSQRIIYKEIYGDNERVNVFVSSKDDTSIRKVKSTINHKSLSGSTVILFLKEVFLPQGFPDSVHPDYIPYQIWDTVQAFASTIMGTLTTHAIMQGVGVGESTATPLAAAITWILKDGTGMIGRIGFAWWIGTELDAQCKKWRLFADFLNDAAMGIELMIPYYSSYSTYVLCISMAMKAVVGVAGGATRAALTQHQALQNNLADVSAKDGSQETFVNLIASLIGIFILSNLPQDGQYVMELYLFLVAIHLYANYSAVKALCLNSLNEDRLALIIKRYLQTQNIPNSTEVNKQESVLLFQNPSKDNFGFHIKMGVSLENVIKKMISTSDMDALVRRFRFEKYLLVMDIKQKTILISFAKGVNSFDILKAYFHASLCSLFTCMILKWPVDIFLKSHSCNPSYPLMRMYIFNKSTTPKVTNKCENPAFIIFNSNDFIFDEYNAFIAQLNKSEWITNTNLLPVGAWRGYWSLVKESN